MVDRAPASTSTDPRARSESALDSRLSALANALGRTLRDLRDRLDSVERRITELPDRTSEPTDDLRAVLAHLEFIRRRLAEPAGDAARKVDMLGERVSMLPQEISGKIDEATEELRTSFAALPAAFADALEPLRGLPGKVEALEELRDLPVKIEETLGTLRAIPERIEESLGAIGEIRNRIAALEGGVAQAREESAAAVGNVSAAVSEQVRGIGDSVSESIGGIEGIEERLNATISERVENIAGRLNSIISERVADVAGRLEKAIEEVRGTTQDRAFFDEQLAKIAEQVVDPEDLARTAREATEAALTTFTEDYVQRSAELEKALKRVDQLSDALASLEKRRGARELFEGEQRLLEQQEVISRRVIETAEHLTERVGAIEGAMNAILERVDQDQLTQEVAGRIEKAVGELKETMSRDLGTRLAHAIAAISKAAADRVAEDVGARVDNLREELTEEAMKTGTKIFMRASAGLTEEIGAIRAKIDSWGRARTAPKVAEQIAGMEKRIEKVARAVEEDLVDAVFDRMQRAFDRRFEVLVQLVEARIRDTLEKQQEPPTSHRRRFVRRGEED
jgi:hypothetical protein